MIGFPPPTSKSHNHVVSVLVQSDSKGSGYSLVFAMLTIRILGILNIYVWGGKCVVGIFVCLLCVAVVVVGIVLVFVDIWHI